MLRNQTTPKSQWLQAMKAYLSHMQQAQGGWADTEGRRLKGSRYLNCWSLYQKETCCGGSLLAFKTLVWK